MRSINPPLPRVVSRACTKLSINHRFPTLHHKFHVCIHFSLIQLTNRLSRGFDGFRVRFRVSNSGVRSSNDFSTEWMSLWLESLNRSVINALFIGGLTWGGSLYIHIRGESGGKKVYSSGTMLLQGWLPVSRRAYITRVSPLRILSARGGGAKLSCKFLFSLNKYIYESSSYE